MHGPRQNWMQSGAPWIWLTAGAVSVSLLIVFGLLGLIIWNGLGHFWPAPVAAFASDRGATQVLGQITGEETVPRHILTDAGEPVPEGMMLVRRYLVKSGNRELQGADFAWYVEPAMGPISFPADAVVLEREDWGNFYGYLVAIKEQGVTLAADAALWPELTARLARRHELRDRVRSIERDAIGAINYALEQLRLDRRTLELAGNAGAAELEAITVRERALEQRYATQAAELATLRQELARDALVIRTAAGAEVELPLTKIVRAYRPNAMGLFAKLGHYAGKVHEFILDDPREANTEGGIFPAIFGTVLLVIVMSIFVTPLGIIAAVYLREYARQNLLTRLVRIAVNNLAGVPSIVYGVFGLGFFVYFLGGSIDQLFYAERLPIPTFGTPGMLWSSLTLALLTVPVVIVATEEGLTRVPRAIREGSLALGATQAETLLRTVLPMATPAMITGLILAVARAAGEVAPLMMVGVVKLAPALPLDGNPPFLHLDRKFMHLGFHIYDVGFQSPNVEAARPLVYATALLLVLVIVTLNLAAIALRQRLRKAYSAADT
ncbi:MAG: phosphate ABC transporter permease PstA [Gammaproteobacteria bacterium]|nr:phosphate ABC transporter permease PstA [Gammaproteobacteria bacterium]